jgi:TolB-like protein
MKTTLRIALLLWAVLLSVQASGQKQDEAIKKQLDQGMAYYSSAQFDRAISLFAELSKNPNLDKATQKLVLFGLCRSYVAKGMKDKAKSTMTKLLSHEPPLIEIDPDVECPALMRVYYEVRKGKTGSCMVERPDPGMKTLAVLDFLNRSVDDREKYNPLEKGFPDLMIGRLHKATNLKVVERERINWILGEIALENDPNKFDVTSAVRVGKLLGVHAVLLGSFIKVEDEIWLGVRLVKVETGEILMTEEVKGDAEEFFDLCESLSEKVAKGINVVLVAEASEKKVETKSLDAMLTYSEGLVALEKGKYRDAYEKFMTALKQDPTYERARARAESIKALAG